MASTPPMGFAGIADLSSNVDDELARLAGPADPAQKATEPSANAVRADVPIASDGARRRTWLIVGGLAAAAVVVAFLIANSNGGSPSNPASSDYSAATTEPTGADQTVAATTEPVSEEMPPPAVGATLTTNQIAYCLAQSIRLDGAKGAVNQDTQADIERYNSMIGDYNSRCGHFRYNTSDLALAQAYTEQNRSDLLSQGAQLFPATAAYSPPASEPSPGQTDSAAAESDQAPVVNPSPGNDSSPQ